MVSGQTEVVTQTRRTPGAPPGRPARGRPGNAAAPARGRTGVRPAPPRPRPAAPRPAGQPRPSGLPRARAGSARRPPSAATAGVARSSRTPFVFLVVGLLGGGLL